MMKHTNVKHVIAKPKCYIHPTEHRFHSRRSNRPQHDSITPNLYQNHTVSKDNNSKHVIYKPVVITPKLQHDSHKIHNNTQKN